MEKGTQCEETFLVTAQVTNNLLSGMLRAGAVVVQYESKGGWSIWETMQAARL